MREEDVSWAAVSILEYTASIGGVLWRGAYAWKDGVNELDNSDYAFYLSYGQSAIISWLAYLIGYIVLKYAQ